jgi:hypothetical protein
MLYRLIIKMIQKVAIRQVNASYHDACVLFSLFSLVTGSTKWKNPLIP